MAYRACYDLGVNPSPLVPPGAARRRAGTALLAYGLFGLVLLGGLALATLVAGVMGRDGIERVDEAIDEVVAVLDATTASLRQGDVTLTNVGVTLGTAATALDEASGLASSLADAAEQLAATASSFEILGQQPFGGVAEPSQSAAESLDRLATQIDAIAEALTTNAQDVTALGDRLGTLADSLTVSRDRLAAVDTSLGGAGLLALGVLLAIIAWLMVPAVAAVAVGRRWRRENPARPG
jgi:hypothetical protein